MANVKVIVKAIACADGSVTQNGNPLFDVASGGTFDLITKLDGVVEDGTWDGVDTLDFTSAACSPVTFQINAVNKESLSSGTTFNLITKLDGAVNSGSYDAPTDTLSSTSAACSPVALQINGTPQESIAAGATFNLIATLDGVAGGTYTPATDTLAFTSTGNWVRPSFWPALPTLTAASEAGYILLPVYENRLNRFSLIIPAGFISWGDGTTSAPTAANRTKTYDYATLTGVDGQIWVDAETGENYKFVIIGITRTGGAITLVDFGELPTSVPLLATNYALEYNLSFPNCTGLYLSGTGGRDSRYVKIIKVWALSTPTQCVLGQTSSLRILQLPPIINTAVRIGNSMGFTPIGDINLGTSNNGRILFASSIIPSHGNLIANSALTLDYYVASNAFIESFGTITANVCTNFESFFDGCKNLKSVGLITLPVCTNYTLSFYDCQSLVAIRVVNALACTSTASMIGRCYSLQVLDMPNLTRGVNFSSTSMGNYGMNIFANGIGTASGAQTITITGTPYGALVTAADATALAIRAVMTGKGYTIAN